ncbi:MAG: DUF1460 domain-containing protein [Bacteroidaceae bacterium]|nr:DUF1460 domain-containing protein [Bacteroidaceae bacterium]
MESPSYCFRFGFGYRYGFLLLLWFCSFSAGAVTSCYEDSIRVVRLLQEAKSQPKDSNMVLYFARQFLGIPYVGHTLEVNREEDLVVNLRQLDCTTLVETVTALTLTHYHGGTSWDDFLQWLLTIRYNQGQLDGYCSRNHYFSQWIASNTQLGLVEEQTGGASGNHYPFTATQQLQLNYMSTHPDAYAMLKGYPERVKTMARLEQAVSGTTVRYIPASLLNQSEKTLRYVCSGDILALVTNKGGLDVSHVGFAQWGRDGKLHLLNASSIHKKVVLEPMTLYQYIQKHPSVLGIRVIRIRI